MTLNERIAKEARTWLGVPYVHRGTTKRGDDCTGLLLGILQSFGYYTDYQLRKYPPDWNLHAMADDFIVDEIKKIAKSIPNKKTIAGDVLIFRWGKCNSHAGIKLNDHLFIHSIAGSKCKISSLKRGPHSSRWSMSFRLDENLLKGAA